MQTAKTQAINAVYRRTALRVRCAFWIVSDNTPHVLAAIIRHCGR